MKALKERIQAKLAEKKLKKQQITMAKPPRYDDVFFEGVKWLDSLAGDPVQEQDGEMDPALPEQRCIDDPGRMAPMAY